VLSSPFVLVHFDICGSSPIKYNLGFKYFVTFIDNYSRCIWLFLMKTRYELSYIFQSFYNEIKNQFGVSIRTLCSDNAYEYLSHSFTTFIKYQGILHKTSCAYTPKQKEVVECKNKHLLETTSTFLIHDVPQLFRLMLFLVHVI